MNGEAMKNKQEIMKVIMEIMRKNNITALDYVEFGIKDFLRKEMITEEQAGEVIHSFHKELNKRFNL